MGRSLQLPTVCTRCVYVMHAQGLEILYAMARAWTDPGQEAVPDGARWVCARGALRVPRSSGARGGKLGADPFIFACFEHPNCVLASPLQAVDCLELPVAHADALSQTRCKPSSSMAP